jgi:uncharacterized protein YjdB
LHANRLAALAALLALVDCGDPTAPPTITSVAFDADAVTLLIDDSVATHLTVTNSAGATVNSPTVSYSSSAGYIASVDNAGKVKAVAAGTATITATTGNVSDQLHVTVNWPPVQSVDLGIANPDVFVEDTVPTTITVLNSKGNPATNAPTTYTTSDPAVATVDALGRIAGVGSGSATITATSEGVSDQVQITVAWPPIVSIAFSRDTATLLLDDSLATTVVVMNSRGRVAKNAAVTYGTSASTTATVDANGRIRTFATGTATISATVGNLTGNLGVTVVPHFTSIGLGEVHTCGISGIGGVWCWGSDAARQLGQPQEVMCGNMQCSMVPLRVPGNQKFVSVTGGAWHTCALTDAGAAYCWGNNSLGQIGNGAIASAVVTAPTAVTGGLTFTSITAGRWHTCGITTANEMYCWGLDAWGELGTGTPPTPRCDWIGTQTPCSPVPMKVVGNQTWSALEATEKTTCGLTTAQTILCWGLSVGGTESTECQNDLPRNDCTRTPLLQASGATFDELLTPSLMICGRSAGGALMCWGVAFYGEFGNGVAFVNSPTPVSAAGGATFAQSVSGRVHVCARQADGAVQCWGKGDYGSSIGSGAPDRLVPTTIAGGITFSTLFGSPQAGHTCGLSTAGRAYCWGDGSFGQLGDAAALNRYQPVLIKLAR